MTDSNECIFCDVASGKLPAYILHKDDHVVAFHDINPKAPVHLLVVPVKHVANLEAETQEQGDIVEKMFRVATKLAADLHFAKGGYRIVMNNGEGAGQIVQHLHLHVLAGRAFDWPPG